MFGIGPMELIVVAVLAIVVVGPKRLPEAMRKMGKMFVQLRRQTHEIRQGFNDVVRDAERELELERIRELKEQVDKLRDTSSIKSKINEHINLSDEDLKIDPDTSKKEKKRDEREYHDSHYQDGEYAHHSDGFVDTDALLAKAKEIEDQVLNRKKDEAGDHEPKPADQTSSESAAATEKPKSDASPAELPQDIGKEEPQKPDSKEKP
ncbi:twin-arginine translocase TatA/TatE family subunit [Pseudobacteriovorax antillogorgiicola]|uniref:Sec-independent protein translocase protein TatB homolog n=1 Tax=Pseudobacteriovorax antillogorgiicola TaxID=1513793 RepID=A0A1Y6BP33_9BACT|nr:twin-arginine translocase TatA/TatE family subunit [Pseudobacteriovorax antillogorgiicola]TCS53944.1 Tat protein translocase TatB subunit [Pseudobacteriovorax antillogorgiicola]SMF20173.1 twin arginine-targeting protein translocase TatB [Pseudobacteriovorax antillogorgiicola]